MPGRKRKLRSVSARILRSIIRNCSSRESIDGISGKAESGIVDENIGNEPALLQACRETLARFGQAEIERKHVDLHLMPGADDALDAVEFAFIARNQAERIALACQQHGKCLADSARGAGDQNPPAHLPLLADVEPCSRSLQNSPYYREERHGEKRHCRLVRGAPRHGL